jgi:hypothetical protein
MTGLEPANGGTTNHCLNHLATLAMNLMDHHTKPEPYPIAIYFKIFFVTIFQP